MRQWGNSAPKVKRFESGWMFAPTTLPSFLPSFRRCGVSSPSSKAGWDNNCPSSRTGKGATLRWDRDVFIVQLVPCKNQLTTTKWPTPLHSWVSAAVAAESNRLYKSPFDSFWLKPPPPPSTVTCTSQTILLSPPPLPPAPSLVGFNSQLGPVSQSVSHKVP